MTDELLPWYNRELSFIRRLGAEFAQAHPKIAGRLRMGPETIEDPHVSRLIEAFAYLNARLRHKIEDDFPEVAEALLGILYPHYLSPIPSMSIVQFVLDRAQSTLLSGYKLPAGAALETEPVQGEPCRFRTGYPVQLWPIALTGAALRGLPYEAPTPRRAAETAAVLDLTLRCLSPEVTFAQMPLQSLRFFLNGLPQHVYPLYELLLNNALEVIVAASPRDPQPRRLDPACIVRVGFAGGEGLLPCSARSFPGYRLLTEFFAFPEKFLFFDLQAFGRDVLAGMGHEMHAYVYLSRSFGDLERNVGPATFQLGCTPIINLFPQRAEPIPLHHLESEYRVVPDARRPLATEVYSIDRVFGTSAGGDEVEYAPLYSVRHGTGGDRGRTFWFATRRRGETQTAVTDHGTEVFASFVDLGFRPSSSADQIVDVETTCLNRDLPHRLPFGGGQPALQLAGGMGPVGRITCLTAPTRTLRPAYGAGSRWRIVSHLSLGHESIAAGEGGAEALREILRLYNFSDSDDTRSMIEGVLDVDSRRVVGRVAGTSGGGICRGVEITLTFDQDRFSGSGLFLFASVLEEFLSLYASINSFTQLVARTRQRKEILRRWPPRSGGKPLL